VAYLGFGPTAYWDAERLDGYVRAAHDLGIAVRASSSPDNEHEAMDRAATALVTAHDRPSAIVCSSDALALAVYRAADHAGLTIGVDLAVSGVDSSVIGRSLVPTLTTMRVPVDRIAELIIERFVAVVDDPDAVVEPALVVPELLPGASTEPDRG
jgi:LacI family transcriptional regulator